MMFVNKPPLTVLFTKTNRDPKFQIRRFAALNIAAMSDSGGKRYVTTGSDLDSLKVEPYWPHLRGVELVPSRHVCVNSTRHERRRHIEHQDVGIMIGSNPIKVFVTHSFCPTIDKIAQLLFVASQFRPFLAR